MAENETKCGPVSTPEDRVKLRQMGAADQVSPVDVERMVNAGLTVDSVEKAKMQGINFLYILQLVNTYGPVAVRVLSDILNYIKPLAPPVVTEEEKN